VTVKISRPAVACVGGPLDGRWYYADDFDTMQRAAARMGYTPDHPAGSALGYVDGDGTVTHPDRQAVGETKGRRMMWRPTAAAVSPREQWGRTA
jgi:hypothetical protein